VAAPRPVPHLGADLPFSRLLFPAAAALADAGQGPPRGERLSSGAGRILSHARGSHGPVHGGSSIGRGAVRAAAVEGSAGRALRRQREAGTVRNPAKAGRSVLWELAG
jgi:hypothetical protein